MVDSPTGADTYAEPSGEAAEHFQDADVIVVGAGPGGSATAAHLAQRGLDVLLLEKSHFPREKVCGDGLTPRVVRELVRLGIDTSKEAGWHHVKGLRIIGGGHAPFTLDWPQLKDFPDYGLTRKRAELDKILADRAVSLGVRLRQDTTVTEPIIDPATGRISGVLSKDGRTFRAPIVVAADGNSSRLAVSMGINKLDKRAMGVAVRAYFKTQRHDDEYMESWLSLEDPAGNLLPGYGWVFPMGDGTCNIGLGMLNTSQAFRNTDYRALLKQWLASTPSQWGWCAENQVGVIGSAALPMAFNRKPVYSRGLLLVGDAGGMVSPFNGEGISYAMESGGFAADAIADAKARGFGSMPAERALQGYQSRLEAEWGGYYGMGAIFAKLIGDPRVMKLCTKYGLPRKTLMRFVNKMLAHLWDKHDGDLSDRILNAMTAIAPKA